MIGGRLHIMVHALDAKNNKLPNGLEVLVTYTDLNRGSKSVPVVLWNLTSSDITIHKGEKIAQVQTANKMPKQSLHPGTLEALHDEQGITRKPLTRAKRQAEVLQELNISTLDEWPEDITQCA